MIFETITKDDRVLITGGTGTLGQALIPKLLERGAQVRVLSRDENKQGAFATKYPQVDWRLGDVRSQAACHDAVRFCSVVIHAASLKYVDLSEKQPSEYLLTNAGGTLNLIEAVLHERTIRACIGISTDKACMPINTYGLTKAMLEKLFIEAHAYRRGEGCKTRFTVCRYGNVIGSRGSVVLKWQEAQAKGERIKVTDPAMTRFFFTVDDAVQLISDAMAQPSGTIIAMAMPSTDLGTLASLWGDFEVIGQRGGEKRHEDLLAPFEMLRTQLGRNMSGVEGIFFYDPLGPKYAAANGNGYDSSNARRLSRQELSVLTAQWRTA